MPRTLQPALAGDALGDLADATARAGETLELAARHLDSALVDVLGILGFNESYVSAKGSYIYYQAGRADLCSGDGLFHLGPGGPRVPLPAPRGGLREPRPQPSRRARGPRGDARRG